MFTGQQSIAPGNKVQKVKPVPEEEKVAAAPKNATKQYDDWGKDFISKVKTTASLVWSDKKTGGKIYVGDINNAADKKLLEKLGCYFVINAQSVYTDNFHEYEEDFSYLRFPIAENDYVPFSCTTPDGALRFMNPLIDTIEEIMEAGNNVFIHCIAGKHRAGACMVSWIMYKTGLNVKDAIKFAQQRRKRINPLEEAKGSTGTLAPLLYAFEEGLKSDPKCNFRKEYNAWDDLEIILNKVPQKKWSTQY